MTRRNLYLVECRPVFVRQFRESASQVVRSHAPVPKPLGVVSRDIVDFLRGDAVTHHPAALIDGSKDESFCDTRAVAPRVERRLRPVRNGHARILSHLPTKSIRTH